ncbi:MAG: 16S rRNA (uracil(1498)-N(3))-methyltransferase [Treponema sp.]|nr:16S rRNA (uracil(1498)-N(3))-methyltransferase [Treponema sp.]
MNIALFTESEINSPLSIKDERGEHIVKVLHKKEGDTFKAGIVGGMVGTATITKIENNEIRFSFNPETPGLVPQPLIMIIGFPRPIQLKRLLRDIAALGVKEVHLTGTELGEKSYMQSNLVEHGTAYKMLLDGTVQAGTTSVPELFLHQTLTECIDSVKKSAGENFQALALDNINPKCSLVEAFQEDLPEGTITVAAIGSERGWTDRERKMLEDFGFVRCGMGKRIMRTETAATVSASVILAERGLLC